MTEQTKPVLLTEAEAAELYGLPKPELFNALRERGLIAPEPVDPLLIEAREIAAAHMPHPYDARQITEGNRDNWHIVQCALAALKRGKEIGEAAARPLTRGAVEMAYFAALHQTVEHEDMSAFLDRLHAALTEQVQQ